jgi:large conductance mechanosensitive channel
VLKGFKDFLMRGNVVDLAVAVVVGTAFTAIVTTIVDHLIKPIIAAIGGTNVTGLSWTIVDGNAASTIDFAAVISAAVYFMIVATVVYFGFVLPVKVVQERRKRGEETGPSEPTDVEVLLEIRDLLRQQQQTQLQQPMGRGPGPFQGGQAGSYPPGGQGPGGPTGPMGPGPAGPGPSGPPPGGPGPRNW